MPWGTIPFDVLLLELNSNSLCSSCDFLLNSSVFILSYMDTRTGLVVEIEEQSPAFFFLILDNSPVQKLPIPLKHTIIKKGSERLASPF